MNRTHYLLASLLIALLGLSIGCIHADLPLEDHEIYVVRTVQEMHDRHDWLVPYFNGEPRLNKPPLSYWLTGMTAWLAHSLDDVRPWHGRVPSILAGLLMTLLIIECGRILYDRRTGLMAGLITVTCSGYFYYTHNARPEMVYSLFCMLGITCFAHAWRRWQQDAPSWLPVLGMWLAFALAMLTKGPQLPLMLILAMMIFLGMQGMAWRRIIASLHLGSGLLILTVLSLWWWWLLRQHVGEAQLMSSQLAGSDLALDWSHLISPYYLYRPLQLLLPWAVLIPAAIVLAYRERRTSEMLLLVLLIVTPAILLTPGHHQRWYYMLPVLGPMAVLLARAGWAWFDPPAQACSPWIRLLLPLHVLLAIGALAWLLARLGKLGMSSPWITAALAVVAMIPMGLRWLRLPRPAADLPALGATFGVVLLAAATSPIIWSDNRFAHAQFAQAVQAKLPPQPHLATWGIWIPSLAYYLHQNVPQLGGHVRPTQLANLLGTADFYLVMPDARIAALPANLQYRVLTHFPHFDGERVSLLAIHAPPPDPAAAPFRERNPELLDD